MNESEKYVDRLINELNDLEQKINNKDMFNRLREISDMEKINITDNNIDVIGIAKSEIEVCIEIFFVRGSKMIGREHYFFSELKDMEDKEVPIAEIKARKEAEEKYFGMYSYDNSMRAVT